MCERNDPDSGRQDTGCMKPLRASVLRPRHPERICWGCDKFCPADDLACGNGTIRTPHPSELLGEDWLDDEPPSGLSDEPL